MKKILVILALLYSSVFANNVDNCRKLSYDFFKTIGRAHFFNFVNSFIEGKPYTQQEYKSIFSIDIKNKAINVSIQILRKNKYYNAANYVEHIFNTEPNKARQIIEKEFNEEYNDLKKLISDGSLENNGDLTDLMELYYKNNEEYLENLAIKLNKCKYY